MVVFRQSRLSTESLLTEHGSASKTPATLPFSSASFQTSSIDFSEQLGHRSGTAPPKAFLDWAAKVLPGLWTPARHLRLLASYLDRIERREIRKLLVTMPPRHAKSTTINQLWLPWYLCRHPDERVILTSYESDFARKWGREARAVVNEFGPLYDLSVKADTKAADEWEIAGHRGGMLTAGIGGAITGRGANVLVIDDPVKNEQEAQSQTIQQRNYDWYRSTASTRMEPDGVQIIIQTRWHENDLAGQLLADEAHAWTVVNLPALAESGDILGRSVGEPLWPERFNQEALEAIRYGAIDPASGQRHGGIGSYFWSALYQQRPSPEEGNIFKRQWWQFYDSLPAGQHFGYTFVDTAGYDDKTTGDYAAIATIVRAGKDLYWKDAQRGHWEFPELVQRLYDAHDIHRLPIVIEDTPWAKPLIQTLSAKLSGVIPFKIEGKSKLTRGQAASPYAEAGNFYLPRNAHWAPEFIDEHAAFPNGAHDDWVDTTSMAALRLLRASFPSQAALRNGHSREGRREYMPA